MGTNGSKPTPKKPQNATQKLERALAQARSEHFVLRLFVTGMTPRSTEAVATVKSICEEHLHGRYSLEVIDIYQNPSRAQEEQIVAVPTLIKVLPKPPRRFVGNLSERERIVSGLDLGRTL